MPDDRQDARQRESRRIIERVAREAESGSRSVVDRVARRAHDHVTAADVDPEDGIEYWGTRIGRILGVFLAVGLIIWLIIFVVRGG
ncbi:MAG: hypothetical protein KKB66_12075 [Alphaproteobacteria bacterium]|jgi:hypothetical protein|nr:hypothetical protein [Alphaproteobacteria bacterium]MBU0805140.1 hypothetical protein [Alphaproteobacteria bacterium]MBU0870639.1 hypothetical protein [Alphaproteobacteria bacterium]MBU1401686.1 hypothetical protein [Alphaproteobacteria bacterium]MBU1591897.1 hypothetical protein [Alphaproteobacteria bacterium]